MEINDVILIVLTTFIITALFIPVVKKMAEFIGAMDIPNARKVHTVPIPRLGGLGIYAGFLIGYMLFGQHSIQMNAVLIGSFIILVTGIFDDICFWIVFEFWDTFLSYNYIIYCGYY